MESRTTCEDRELVLLEESYVYDTLQSPPTFQLRGICLVKSSTEGFGSGEES